MLWQRCRSKSRPDLAFRITVTRLLSAAVRQVNPPQMESQIHSRARKTWKRVLQEARLHCTGSVKPPSSCDRRRSIKFNSDGDVALSRRSKHRRSFADQKRLRNEMPSRSEDAHGLPFLSPPGMYSRVQVRQRLIRLLHHAARGKVEQVQPLSLLHCTEFRMMKGCCGTVTAKNLMGCRCVFADLLEGLSCSSCGLVESHKVPCKRTKTSHDS